MSADSDNSVEKAQGGCAALITGSFIAPVVLFIVGQALYGSHRHDSSAGWNFAPLLPYLWPLVWLPAYWLAFVCIHPIVRRRATHSPESAASNASMIAIIIYVILALLVRWSFRQGSFDFYG